MNFDNFHGEQMSTLTYGKHLHEYGKFIIMEVLIYYCHHPTRIDDQDKYDRLKEVMASILERKDRSVDELWNELLHGIEVETPEGVMSYAFVAFRPDQNDLLYKTFLTFGKIKPLGNITEWFNNFRLNGISNGMNMVVWQDNDREKTYGVRRNPKPINTGINLHDPDHAVEMLVGTLRRFIIENNLYQTNPVYRIVEPTFKTMSSIDVCDACYEHYPFYYGGCHGCDFYLYSGISLSISELVQFMKRYPSAIIGYIVNTATYRSGNGKHWMSLTFSDMHSYLVCSGGNSYESFDDGGSLKSALMKKGISMEFNPRTIQVDHSSCGMYSVLSNYLMLCNNCNIAATIDKMGEDCTKLVNGKNIMAFINAIAM